jgi:hypothetical protein
LGNTAVKSVGISSEQQWSIPEHPLVSDRGHAALRQLVEGVDLQQHWTTLSNSIELYVVYTRSGAGSDHVFRHRAPLFIAQVDRDKRHIIRSTEQILVPERGARLGNFGVANITPNETWIVVTEWMQTWGRTT